MKIIAIFYPNSDLFWIGRVPNLVLAENEEYSRFLLRIGFLFAVEILFRPFGGVF